MTQHEQTNVPGRITPRGCGRTGVAAYISDTIAMMQAGTHLWRGSHYTESGIANWKKILGIWERFETETGRCGIDFDSFSPEVLNSFFFWLDMTGCRESSKSQYSTLLKAVLNSALESGCSNNTIHLTRKFRKCRAQMDDIMKVYLAENEIEAIRTLALPPHGTLDKVRDVFLMGCYTGQRFSDYSTLGMTDIVTVMAEGKNHKVFCKRQKKTGNVILIPILFCWIEEMLAKWGGSVPDVSISCLNKRIKDISRLAGINTPVLLQDGGAPRTVPKWRMISSHTARRSFITNMYLGGVLSPEQLRSISGHRSEAAFRRYLCFSSEEMVRSIFSAWDTRSHYLR